MAQFRLQRILEYRCQRTAVLKQEHDEAQQCLNRETMRLEQIETESCRHRERFESTQGTAFLGDELQIMYQTYHDLQQQIDTQEEMTRHAVTVVEVRRKMLIKAQQDERMLEKLKEKEKLRDLAKRAVHEQQSLDELIMTRSHYARNTDAGGHCA